MRNALTFVAGLLASSMISALPVYGQDSGLEIAQLADPNAQSAAPNEPPPAETDIFSMNAFSLLIEARALGINGEQSFLDRGMGKTRFSGGPGGDFEAELAPIEADIIWTPRFTRSLAGNVSAGWQRDQENSFDLMEAYLAFLPARGETFSFAAKAGLYWPEISLEHSTGGAWSTVHTITPSAINSWIGEEVKVIGLEGTLTASLGAHDISATGGVFGYNDTSGTLLSFRGWALHDLKATAGSHIQLPQLSPFMTVAQAPTTRSLIELDNRAGFYGRVEWRLPSAVSINAFYYDNHGDPEVFDADLQWGWRTKFWNLGMAADLAPGTRLLAQAMVGTTLMGHVPPGLTQYWVDTKYRSSFVLLAQDILDGRGQISGRVEVFDTEETGSRMSPTEAEDGRAATLAGRYRFNDKVTGFVEILRVDSERGARTRTGLPPKENQTLIQASLRITL